MKILRILRTIAGNLMVVAVLVLGTAKVLDWYNPYMDFGGHVSFMNFVLAGAAAVFAVLSAYSGYQKLMQRERAADMEKLKNRKRKRQNPAAGAV